MVIYNDIHLFIFYFLDNVVDYDCSDHDLLIVDIINQELSQFNSPLLSRNLEYDQFERIIHSIENIAYQVCFPYKLVTFN